MQKIFMRMLGLVGLLGTAGCTEGLLASTPDAGQVVAAVCTGRQDCGDPTKEVCSGGICIPGECEVRADCPFARDQICNLEFFRCDPDPDSPIGSECPAGDQDCNLGQFCSAGTCYKTADHQTCSRSSQCAASERCDARVSFCVPNLGGCDRCGDYPELCCQPVDEACDQETKRCRPVSSNECTVATQADDCRAGERCVDARCIQCLVDEECGPGTVCNPVTGACVSSSGCESDADCAAFPGRKCAPSTRQCTLPQCTSDGQCDGQQRCNLETFQCYLPPAVCQEGTTEPNNTQAQATPITTVVGGTRTITGTLCRGDLDFLSFPANANKRLQVSVTVTPSASVYGVGLELVAPGGAILASSTFGFTGNTKRLGGNVATAGTAYLRITSSTDTEINSWTYVVEVSETEPLMCETELGEPNNLPANAGNSVLAVGDVTRALCGPTDLDYHQVLLPAGKRLTVSMDYNDDYSMELTLLSTSLSQYQTDSFGLPLLVGYSNSGTSQVTVLVRVEHYTTFSLPAPEEPVPYTLTVAVEDLPTCTDGAFEPNESIAQSKSVGVGVTQGVMCESSDKDTFKVSLATAGSFNARVAWTGTADLDVILYNNAGTQVSSAAGASNPETINVASLAAGTYHVQVKPYLGSTTTFPVAYTLTLTAPGFCVDDMLDTGAGNDRVADATGIRDAVDGPLLYQRSLALCRQDEDWFRLVALGDERIEVSVAGGTGTYAVVYRSTATGPEQVARSREVTLTDGSKIQHVSAPVDVPAGLYFVKVAGGVSTEGAYALEITTPTDPCSLTGVDLEPNDTKGMALDLPPSGPAHGIFCPVLDEDIYRFNAGPGANLGVSVAFDATVGDVDVELWASDGAVPLAQSVDVETGATATATFTQTVATGGAYFVRVFRKNAPGAPVGQPYDLTVSGGSSGSSSSGGSSSRAVSGGSSSASLGSGSASGIPSSGASAATSGSGTASGASDVGSSAGLPASSAGTSGIPSSASPAGSSGVDASSFAPGSSAAAPSSLLGGSSSPGAASSGVVGSSGG